MAANVQSLVQYWKNFSLPRLQKELDNTATELANRQDESDASRKKLVELSREFKNTTPEDIRRAVAPLLKNFQAEVDSLSKRSKAAEAAFLAVYKNVIEVPDPAPCLELCHAAQQKAMRTQDLEIENKQLRDTLNEYNEELKDVRNQEVTIKQLKDKLKEYEGKVESTAQARTKEKEKEFERDFAEKEQQLHDSHLAVVKNLEEAEHKVSELQSALECTQSELFDFRAKYDEDSLAKSDEMEIVMNDLERANQRAAVAEKEVDHLKEQLAAVKHSLQLADQIQKAPDMEQAVDVLARSSLEVELAAKEKEISQLVDDIQKLQSTINILKETSASHIAQLEEMLSDKNKIIQRLEEKLDSQKDYEEIKKELIILKSMEFPEHDSESGRESPKSPKHLEVLLLEKNKTLQSENTALKVAKTELSSTPPLPGTQFPHPLQTVECFGSFLGEEIVSKLLKREDINRSPSTPKSTEDTRSSSAGPDITIPPPPPLTISIKHVPHSPEQSLPPQPMIEMGNVSVGRLQECLRLNIDKYANETLNTLNISRCVRELLSVHNIGQRLFAKFVLGLSQGTVSELLSKPKPWDKLTEKGRDSYRKMHAWAYDETCINMLKALVPRKGKDISLPSLRQEDVAAEERIVQILNEANMSMVHTNKENKIQLHNGNNNNNGSSFLEQKITNHHHHMMEDSRGDSGGNEPIGGGERRVLLHNNNNNNNNNNLIYAASRRAKKYENDDISHDMVTRIYQQELSKLLGQHSDDGFRSRDGYERTQEEIRQALTIYHQELARLSQLSPLASSESFSRFAAAAAAAASAFPHGVLMNGGYANMLPGNVSPSERQDVPIDATMSSRGRHHSERSDSDAIRHHGSAFSLVRPKVEPAASPNKQVGSYPQMSGSPTGTPGGGLISMAEGPDDLSTSASPLQRMQSITNSLLSQSSMPTMPSSVSRPTKAVLPPITQHQFDQYNNLNTEDIVKKVKEQLSQYSISQRLFGESVLGLSQGSVSDLLARPKPWHMLTQKGREPFIRMKIFLEDDNAVHKLVASQYKIAPEKLMRTGNYTGVPSPIVNTNKGNPRTMESSGTLPHKSMEGPPHPTNSGYSQHADSVRSCSPPPEAHNVPLPPNPTLLNSCVTTSQVHSNGRRSHHVSRSPSYMQPSVYEMAALTTDLDTQSITSKIKETLMAHNIGQKIFGEAVLGLSQGSVSELLSKPKPWHMLSIKGREPFIRMQLWLSDPHNVEKLQAIKNQRREANKRRRNTDYSDACTPQQQTTFSFHFTPPSSYPASKKPRVLFTEEQKEALRLAFTMDPYPSTGTIEFLASELGLSIRTITNWFHNHRMRLKQNASPNPDDPKMPSGDGVLAIAGNILPGVREGATFDPVQFRTLLSRRLSDLQCQKGMQFNAGLPYLYPLYRNCSPDSSGHADDMGTLDLSMSSQHNSKCESVSSLKSDLCGDDHSSSDMNEDSSFSQDQGNTEGSDHESMDESSSMAATSEDKRPINFTTTISGGGSNRRKRAMPQWVDPGLEFSPNSDVNSDESDEDDTIPSGHEIINGVCVRQTDGFDLRIPREETVRIEPVPAPDHEPTAALRNKDRMRTEGPSEDRLRGADSYRNADDSQSANDTRQDNIKRLEKSVSEQEESWGCSEDDYEDESRHDSGTEKPQQRIEKGQTKEDWEF